MTLPNRACWKEQTYIMLKYKSYTLCKLGSGKGWMLWGRGLGQARKHNKNNTIPIISLNMHPRRSFFLDTAPAPKLWNVTSVFQLWPPHIFQASLHISISKGHVTTFLKILQKSCCTTTFNVATNYILFQGHCTHCCTYCCSDCTCKYFIHIPSYQITKSVLHSCRKSKFLVHLSPFTNFPDCYFKRQFYNDNLFLPAQEQNRYIHDKIYVSSSFYFFVSSKPLANLENNFPHNENSMNSIHEPTFNITI